MSSESLKSLIVTDPDLVDPELDVSGLRTQTDTDPRLLASIADFPGISYDPTRFDYLSDLNELFAYGLPVVDTQTTTPDTGAGGGGTGDGGQATAPGAIDTLVTPPDTGVGVNTPEEQRLIDAGIGLQDQIGDPVVAPGEIPVTQQQLDDFNQIPVTPVSPPGQPIDPTGMLPQTSTPFMVEGALGVDSREKMDFVTEEDLADNTNLLQRLGLPANFDLSKAALEAGINLAVGVPISLIARGLGAVLPDRDPRQTALEELYDVQDGTIQSGLMKGYNPVSGNPLDPTYGLQEAYQDRIDTIENTLKTKYNMTDAEIADVKAGSYTGDVDTNLFKTLTDLEEAKEKEKNVLDLYSGDIDERDQMLEDIVLQNKIDEGIQAADDDKGDNMLDTTGVNPFKDIDTGVGEFDTGTNIVDEVALTGGDTPNIIEDIGIENIQESIDRAVDQNIIDRGGGDEFYTTPVDEFSDEEFMVGDTSTAAPTGGDSGVDSFFDAVDTATGGGGGRDRDPDPSPSFDPGQGFVDQGGGGEFETGPVSTFSAEEEDEIGEDRGGGDDGGGDKGGGGCVIATHAVNSGAFTKDTKREAVRWCVKNLHRTWWGEAIRRGYRYYGQKAIEEGKAKNHYQEFKDYVAFGTGKRRTLKTGWTFVYRSVQFFIRGLING